MATYSGKAHACYPTGACFKIFSVTEPTLRNLAECTAQIHLLHIAAPRDVTLRYVVNYTPERTPPVAACIQHLDYWIKRQPADLKLRVVFMSNNQVFRGIIEQALKSMLSKCKDHVLINYFDTKNYDTAVRWLCGGCPQASDEHRIVGYRRTEKVKLTI